MNPGELTTMGCKPSKKNDIEPQVLLVVIKKYGGSGLTPIHTEYQK